MYISVLYWDNVINVLQTFKIINWILILLCCKIQIFDSSYFLQMCYICNHRDHWFASSYIILCTRERNYRFHLSIVSTHLVVWSNKSSPYMLCQSLYLTQHQDILLCKTSIYLTEQTISYLPHVIRLQVIVVFSHITSNCPSISAPRAMMY